MILVVSFGRFYYDSNKLSDSDIPTDYLSLLDPKWKGKLVLTYPNDDDAVAYLFHLAVSRYGFDWFEALNQQDVKWVRGSATPYILLAQEVNNAESQYTLSFSTTQVAGYSDLVHAKVPTEEEFLSWYQTMAIFKSTKCPETAKLFVSWILSDEWQAPLSKTLYTPLNHLNTQSGNQLFLVNYTQSQGFRQFEHDRTLVEWWKTQFETTLGPAVGVNPNEIY